MCTCHSLETVTATAVAAAVPLDTWLCNGIRVKLVGTEYERDAHGNPGPHYCRKGVIASVTAVTEATAKATAKASVLMDSGALLADVAEGSLETVVPTIGGKIQILKVRNKQRDVSRNQLSLTSASLTARSINRCPSIALR